MVGGEIVLIRNPTDRPAAHFLCARPGTATLPVIPNSGLGRSADSPEQRLAGALLATCEECDREDLDTILAIQYDKAAPS